MSFHTITMLTYWVTTADSKLASMFDELASLPYEERLRDSRVKDLIIQFKNYLKNANNRIHTMALMGWNDKEVRELLCSLLSQLEEVRKQYSAEVSQHGKPKLEDKDFIKYEQEILKESKIMRNK